VSPQDAAPLVAEIRHQLAFDVKLLHAQTRTTSWNYADDGLLQDVGDFARLHAHSLTRNVVPALEGMAARFAGRDAAFLDIGVGVAGTAIEMAKLWPTLRVVGLDVWKPSLVLARENVAKDGLGDRIELREQGAEQLEDDRVFDLAWMPMLFMPERVIRPAVARTKQSLRPGGWVVMAFANLGVTDPLAKAFWRLRTTMFGGPLWLPETVETLLRDEGYTDVRALPSPPGVPVVLVVGRRAPE
jgi:SAM-dependent methyltransferase